MADRTAAIKQLQRTFGNIIDKDVLESVLDVCNNDVDEATNFLQADVGGYAYNPNQTNSIPQDYPGQRKYVGYGASASTANKEDIEQKMKTLFIQESTYQEHYDAQTNNYNTYVAVAILLFQFNVEMCKGSKTRMLAAAWARHDDTMVKYLLSQEENFNLPQILGALNLLDSQRKIRALRRKLTKAEEAGNVKSKKVSKIKSTINDLSREPCTNGSVSGALAKKVRRWVKGIPAEQLTFFALTLPKEPWRELADIIHLNPKKDFQCPFLEIAFNDKPEEGSMIAECTNLSADNCAELAKKWKIPYSYLRLKVKPLPAAAKVSVAGYASLDTLIWFHEELVCAEVNAEISKRLTNGEQPKFGYGKLMERLLYLKREGADFYQLLEPIADRRLKNLHLSLESPVSVIGDASFSMDVAIRCATIIGSVLTLLTNAELRFFHSECVVPAIQPRNVAQALDVATKTKAEGLTAPACSILDFYNNKKVVKFFIVVTDEIENEKYLGHYFPDLFMKYYKEVYPAKLVFVSFLANPSEKGRMVTALENMGCVPLQFRLDGNRPDLQKLDSLLGLLATESSSFKTQTTNIVAQLEKRGLLETLKQMEKEREVVYDDSIPITNSAGAETTAPVSNNATAAVAAPATEQFNTEAVEQQVAEFVHIEREKADKRAQGEPEKADKTCVVCLERNVNTVILECGHLVLCDVCAPAVVAKNSCPLCRGAITRSLRVYHDV